MDIHNRRELESWNLGWAGEQPSRLTTDGVRLALGARTADIGIYFIGDGSGSDSDMRYVGKSLKSLHQRLLQHVRSSSNDEIRARLAAGIPLWFHYLAFKGKDGTKLADLAEGLFIVALFTGPDMKFTGWNRRQEWRQHWAAEDDNFSPA